MKLRFNGLGVLSVLVVAISLAGLATGNPYCLIQNSVTTEGNGTCYACFQSKNYIEDLEAAPTELAVVTFSNSDIPVLKNGSFAKFADIVAFIGFHSVGLRDIEDNAFEGLNNLYLLAIIDNKLEVIKGEWFRNLPKLTVISLEKNLIHTIEGSFFTNVESLGMLHLGGNKLTGLPHTEFEAFTLFRIAIRDNPWSAEDRTWLETTLQQKNITTVYMSAMDDERIVINVDVTSEASSPHPVHTETTEQTGQTDSTLTNVEIHSPAELCVFLQNHASAFYEC